MSKASPKSEAIAGPLYDLLVEKLPACCGEGGSLQIARLADRLTMSHEGVYRWLRSNEISKRGRKRLLEISASEDNMALLAGAPLTEDDLRPFL